MCNASQRPRSGRPREGGEAARRGSTALRSLGVRRLACAALLLSGCIGSLPTETLPSSDAGANRPPSPFDAGGKDATPPLDAAGPLEATISVDSAGPLDASGDVEAASPFDAPDDDAGGAVDAGGGVDAGSPVDTGGGGSDAGSAPPCTTTVTYGAAWIHDATTHPSTYDVAQGVVTWDGTCTTSVSNSYALLSNGWQPYFTGKDACILGLDYPSSCGESGGCTTRVTYGSEWIHPTNHPNQYDDVTGQVSATGSCKNSGSGSYIDLSNGWVAHFTGNGACGLSFRYMNCNGL